MSNKNTENIINMNIKTEDKLQPFEPVIKTHKTSNPIYKKLLNLSHNSLTKFDKKYKPFSGFKPENLR